MTELIARTACKVLLVDDEENIVRSIARLLMEDDLDLEVLTANCGAAGLAVIASHPDVALILADQRMPGMSGAEFLQEARVAAPDAVRMVLTGYADMTATMDAINKGGAWRYLTKPWDDEVLRRTILEGVGQYRLLQENRALHALVEKQNRELSEWNDSLKGRVLEQTSTIRRQNDELKERNRKIGASFQQTILAFSRLIEQHSSQLQEHTRNVTELSVQAAAALRLPPEEVETIRNAALLHDIGVIGMPAELLDRPPAELSGEQLKIFLQHAVRGQTALDAVEELRGAGLLIRHHHELYGGRGFPDGVAGAAIPLGSRIIAFADFVDRELDEQRGESAVLSVLARAKRESGSRLDPALLETMMPLIGALYTPARSRRAGPAEKELRPKQLLPGMTVTRNLYSGAGVRLLTKGTVLDPASIVTALRQCALDPPSGGVFVSWKPSAAGAGPQTDLCLDGAEKELRPKQLQAGMRITRNIYSGTGLLLLTEGTELDAGCIVAVSRYYEIDPPLCGIFVENAPNPPNPC